MACLLAIAIWCGSSTAQPTDVAGCQWAIESAEERYTAGQFRDALVLLDPCLHQEALPSEMRQGALRIAILSHLRREERTQATLLLGQLLSLDPGYAPDPIIDPPAYVSFFQEVAPHLVAEDTPPRVLVPHSPDQPRLAADWLITATLGFGSYGGERGKPADNPIADFSANAGLSLALSAAIPVVPQLFAGIRLQGHYLPTRFHYDWVGPEPLRQNASSAWSAALLAEVMWTVPEQWSMEPALRFAVGGVLSRLNERVRAGLILQPGLDLGIVVDDAWTLLLHTDLGVVLPGTALDLQDRSPLREGTRGYDLVTQLGLGVRYRLPSPALR